MKKLRYNLLNLFLLTLSIVSCKVPNLAPSNVNLNVPKSYTAGLDSANIAIIQWRSFYNDKYLADLIDTALKNNQELLIRQQEIEISRNDIRLNNRSLFPTVYGVAGLGLEKVGRYTSQGAGDASTEIIPGKKIPDPLKDYKFGFSASWEVDVWKKFHNSKKAALNRYLSSVEGKNFFYTNLIAEIANSYYELLALDNQLETVRQSVLLQQSALEVMKIQKDAARVNELAVQKFKAEVLNSQGIEFGIQQQITESENRLNLLLGRYPQEIPRNRNIYMDLIPKTVKEGIPSQLLANRPDVRQAEFELKAAKLDVEVAKAEFYPSLGISSSLGMQAFKPSYLLKVPESVLYSLAADITGPLINRSAIKAEFYSANSRQLQALYNYQRILLNAYLEVNSQLANINNLQKVYALKQEESVVLSNSITISNDLFRSSRADYMEILMTQRDALTVKLELIETKKKQLSAVTNIYQQLGGGWQ